MDPNTPIVPPAQNETQTIQPNLQQQPINRNSFSINKLKKLITLILIILVFVIVGINYLRTKQNKSIVQNQQITIVPTIMQSIPTLNPDLTINGGSYTNKLCKYTVKIPVDWEKSFDPFIGEESVNFKPKNTNMIASSDKSINISATSLKKIPAINLKDEVDNYNSFLWKNWTNKKIANINFEGVNAIKATGESYGVAHNEVLLIANDCYIELKGVGDYMPTFTQILSTFKFTQ